MESPILLRPLVSRPRLAREGKHHHFHRCPRCGGALILRGPARLAACRECRKKALRN